MKETRALKSLTKNSLVNQIKKDLMTKQWFPIGFSKPKRSSSIAARQLTLGKTFRKVEKDSRGSTGGGTMNNTLKGSVEITAN